MVELADRIARAMNAHTDSAFTGALSDGDRSALSAMMEEFFCADRDQGTRTTNMNTNHSTTALSSTETIMLC